LIAAARLRIAQERSLLRNESYMRLTLQAFRYV
jgi:hypothetical protein